MEITAWGARVRTLIIETNEELMIARDTRDVIEEQGQEPAAEDAEA